MLIVARGIQGIGAALLVPQSLAIISASFPREQRGRALLQVAAIQLKRLTPDAADPIIDLAVQLAVVQLRAERRESR